MELVPASSPVPTEDVATGGDGEDLVPSSTEAKEEAVSPIVGEMPNAAATSGGTEEAKEEDPGPALLIVSDDADQGPLCLPGVLGVKDRDEFPLATKLIPRSTVVFPRSDVRVTAPLVSTELEARRGACVDHWGGELGSSSGTELTRLAASDGASPVLDVESVSAAGDVGSIDGGLMGRGGEELCPASVLGGPEGLDSDPLMLPLVPQAVIPLVEISEGE